MRFYIILLSRNAFHKTETYAKGSPTKNPSSGFSVGDPFTSVSTRFVPRSIYFPPAA